MNNNYWSLTDFDADSHTVKVCLLERVELLDDCNVVIVKQAGAGDLKQTVKDKQYNKGAVLEVPVWLARRLVHMRLAYIPIDPSPCRQVNRLVRDCVQAGPRSIQMADVLSQDGASSHFLGGTHQSFYPLMRRLSALQPALHSCSLGLECLRGRLSLLTEPFSYTASSSNISSPSDTLHKLDKFEQRIFKQAQRTAKQVNGWASRL